MKKLPPKQQQNKTNGGISIRDALSAISGNSHFMVLPVIIALVMCGFCSVLLLIPRNQGEACNPEGHIYQALLSQSQEWVAYFDRLPTNPSNFINLEGGSYIVRSLWRSPDGRPTLLIATQQTYPRTFYGNAGYIYTSGERFVFLDSGYCSRQLSPHIYCYERLSS